MLESLSPDVRTTYHSESAQCDPTIRGSDGAGQFLVKGVGVSQDAAESVDLAVPIADAKIWLPRSGTH